MVLEADMSNLNSNMKKMGRNLARAANQGGGKGYKDGGMVSAPVKPTKMSGGGMARGGGAATKGKKFSGCC